MHRRITFVTLLLLLGIPNSNSCSNILVTPGASKDGSAMIAYNADSANLMGMVYHYPAKESIPEGTTRDVYEWDTGKYLGAIPEASETYNVVGNINEHGLVIGETTFGGLAQLTSQPNALIDYGSLIYITLQRSTNARDAIRTIADLLDTYGYYSEGESFSIADKNEVWHMELIGRGRDKVGAVWVAMKIPDGYVGGHANQARITTFPQNDADNCLFSDDVVDFARDIGLYEGSDEDFSFSDTYDPVTFEGARFSEARVWSMFSALSDESFQSQYADYAMGANLTNRMPLFIQPLSKLSISDVYDRFSNHYEDSPLDFSSDAGAGHGHSPNRPRPLTWDYQKVTYLNERSIATPQTGWNYVAQVRGWLPRELAAVMWFGADDSSTAPRVPVYGCATQLSPAYAGVGPQDGVPNLVLNFDLTKAFFVQNMVSNLAYSRWDVIYPVLSNRLREVRELFHSQTMIVETEALQLYHTHGKEVAVEHLTAATVRFGDEMQSLWFQFYGELFVRFRDGYDIVPDVDNTECECEVKNVEFSDDWKSRIVQETGTHYEEMSSFGVSIGEDGHVIIDKNAFDGTDVKSLTKNKLLLKAMM